MKKLLTIVFVSLGLLVPVMASAQTFSKDDVATVKMLLSGYHGLPDQALFDGVSNAEKIVQSLSVRNDFVGDRALVALGTYWPTDAVLDTYRKTLEDPAVRFGRKELVMAAAATAFGDRVLSALEPLLTDRDVQVRVSAIQSIATISTEASHAVIKKAASVETNEYVLGAFKKYGRSIH